MTMKMKMRKKEGSERTKVVIRQLPPSLTQSDLFSLFRNIFSHLSYNWFSFVPGNSSSQNQKHPKCSRAYVDFMSSYDVLDFANSFHGHVFVNDKGIQFKAIVEYAPCQRVPKPSTQKDARQDTIYRDPDYLDFLKLIAKPVAKITSTEFQLEIKEAEQSGGAVMEAPPIVTPLMEFVRQKRAANSGTQTQAPSAAVKNSKRVGTASLTKSGSRNTKQGSDKKKHILKDSTKNSKQKKKSTATVVPRQEGELTISSGKAALEIESNPGRKKILLLKGKEHETPLVSEGMLQQSGPTFTPGNQPVSAGLKQNHRREGSERLMRSILVTNEAHQNHSLVSIQSCHTFKKLNLENDKLLSQPMKKQVGLNDHAPIGEQPVFISHADAKRTSYDKFEKACHGLGFVNGKREKRTRYKDRQYRGVCTPLHITSTVLQHNEMHSDSVKVTHGEMEDHMHCQSHNGQATGRTNGCNNSYAENGSQRHFGGCLEFHNRKSAGSLNTTNGKSSKRGAAPGRAAHKVWIRKLSPSS